MILRSQFYQFLNQLQRNHKPFSVYSTWTIVMNCLLDAAHRHINRSPLPLQVLLLITCCSPHMWTRKLTVALSEKRIACHHQLRICGTICVRFLVKAQSGAEVWGASDHGLNNEPRMWLILIKNSSRLLYYIQHAYTIVWVYGCFIRLIGHWTML